MEILLDGLLNKKEKLKNVLAQTKSRYYIGIIALVGVSFLLGRTLVLDAVFPCGIAMISALVSKGRANIYLMPFIIMGTMTYYGTTYEVFGDIVATMICGTVFFVLCKNKLKVSYVAFTAMCITFCTKGTFVILSTVFIPLDIIMVGVEGVSVAALVYMFNIFFCIKEKNKNVKESVAQGVVAMSVVLVLIVSGMGIEYIGSISPVYVVALFITLFIGYKMGIMEGAIAGISSGAAAVMVTMSSPAVMGIFACSGVAAGFFMGLSSLVAGVVFAAVPIGLGLIQSFPELYIPVLNPLLAAIVFMLLPKRALSWLELAFSRLRRDEHYFDLVGRENSKKILYEYVNSFDRMASLKDNQGESNSMIQLQFKALSKLGKKMIMDLDNPIAAFSVRPFKYTIKVGVSTYAKENNVCGDSYMCTEFRKGTYMLALSDGMGKGLRAAEESTTTITGLYNLMKAGFDINLALHTMNSILLNKSPDEIFSTVDMCIFDRTSGKMLLYKIGAAATFIKRGSIVEAIKVSSLPIGLVNNISVDYIEVQAKKGDKIIFVSDGITEADYLEGGIEWLRATIEEIKSNDPQTISDLIINKAVERYGIREKDDMTVITSLVV